MPIPQYPSYDLKLQAYSAYGYLKQSSADTRLMPRSQSAYLYTLHNTGSSSAASRVQKGAPIPADKCVTGMAINVSVTMGGVEKSLHATNARCQVFPLKFEVYTSSLGR